jgi:hypothetical protein
MANRHSSRLIYLTFLRKRTDCYAVASGADGTPIREVSTRRWNMKHQFYWRRTGCALTQRRRQLAYPASSQKEKRRILFSAWWRVRECEELRLSSRRNFWRVMEIYLMPEYEITPICEWGKKKYEKESTTLWLVIHRADIKAGNRTSPIILEDFGFFPNSLLQLLCSGSRVYEMKLFRSIWRRKVVWTVDHKPFPLLH